MMQCEQFQTQITFYLDDELHGPELAEFEAHAAVCAVCRAACEQEQEFLEHLRESGPLQTAGPELRSRITQLLDKVPPPVSAPPRLRRRIERLWPVLRPASRFPLRPQGAVLAVIAACALLAVWWFGGERRDKPSPVVAPSDFVLLAVETHVQRQRGQLSLEFVSDSPEKVSAWFEGKVPFRLHLPNYTEDPGRERLYHLEGARLVAFKNTVAAHIAYRLQNHPVTLLATSASGTDFVAGEAFVSKGRTFHHNSIKGLNVLTWQDHGLAYVLVSDLEERGQRSCIVCHASEKERSLVEGLRQATW